MIYYCKTYPSSVYHRDTNTNTQVTPNIDIDTIQYNITPYDAMLCYTKLCYAMLYCNLSDAPT